MDADRWRQIEEFYHRASDLPEQDRDAFLDRECLDASVREDAPSPDGKKFLIFDRSESGAPEPLHVILNVNAALKR